MNQRPGKLLVSIFGGLILLLLVGNIAGGSHPHATTPAGVSAVVTTQAQTLSASEKLVPPTSAPSRPPAELQGQDRYNDTRRFREFERLQQLTRPAYQHLPYRTSHVRIAISNVTSDGRILLSVTPLGPNVSPQVEYHAFLARYHDPGSAYLAVYIR
jgi:hypothetical protein